MTVYFMGSEAEIFDSFGGSSTTDASVTIAGQNRAGILLLGSTQTASANFTAQTEGWLHYRFGRSGTTGPGTQTHDYLRLRNAEGQNLFKMSCSSDSVISTVTILSQTAFSLGVSSGTVDVNFKVAAVDGFVRVWLNGILVTQFTGNTQLPSGTQSISNLYVQGVSSSSINFSAFFSQFLISDLPTVNAKVITLPLSLTATDDWDGDANNVIGTSTSGISNAIKEQVVDGKILFGVANVASLSTNEFIGGVSISARALAENGSNVTKIAWISDNGVAELENSTTATLGTTFAGVRYNMTVNPHTSSEWTLSDLNNIQLGMKAKA